MAFKRMTIDGFGQVELNNCAFRRDGRIEAQCAPDATVFENMPVENGMILAVDNVTRTVKMPDGTLPVALVYTAEHMYDERFAGGLKHFKTEAKDDFYPRLGYLSIGDKFTTNCIGYNDTEFTNDDALITALGNIGTTPVYGGESANGVIVLSATKPTAKVVMKVVKFYTMPDGQKGVKLQVIA